MEIGTALGNGEGFFLASFSPGDQLGFSVRNAGDLDGDGLDDFVMGAPYQDSGGLNAGAAFVFRGTTTPVLGGVNLLGGPNADTVFRLYGQTGGGLGYSVSGAGDINGDGYDDLILGAPFGGGSGGDGVYGTIYISLGRAQYPPTIVFDPAGQAPNNYDLLAGGPSYRSAGAFVGSAGDLNGDGVDEYSFGSNGSFSERDPLATASDFDGDFSWVFTSPRGAVPAVRNVINGAGDVNNDGIDDVLVSGEDRAPNNDVVRIAFLVHGSATGGMPTGIAGINGTTGTRFDSLSQTDGYWENPLGSAGDFNGDGIDDFLVGDAVVFGRIGGFGANFDLNTLDGTNGFRLTGSLIWSASSAGDINGDGFGDLIIGDPRADPEGRVDAGSVWIVYGGPGSWGASLNLLTLSDSQGRRFDGSHAGDRFGYSVSGAGDINGDGYDEVVMGAPGQDDFGGAESGLVYVILGRPVAGPSSYVGTAQNDTVTGSAGADFLYGMGGDDLLLGRMGADRLDGGPGSDTVSYAGDFGAVWVSLTEDLGRWNAAEGDVLIGIENLIGTDYDDVLIGDASNNRLQGGSGNDALYGQGGNNVLVGGLGADSLYGGGAGEDIADYSGNFGAVWVDLSTGQGHWNYAEGDSLSAIDHLIGTQYGDRLTGDGADNRLHGGLGGDILTGGGGSDTADYAGDFGAVWVDLSTGQGHWNYAEGDSLSGIENLTGTTFNDRLTGDGGDNRLHGGLGGDVLQGGGGSDTADYAGDFGAVWVDLSTGQGRWNYAEGDSLSGIENLTGTDYGDRLTGDAGDNRLHGGLGGDVLSGGAGSDTADYAGDYGAVWVDLAAGVGRWNYAEGDSLSGMENVVGTSYGDRLGGNAANNVLTGGAGSDSFLMAAGFGKDVITDFDGAGAGSGDVIGFAAGLFADFADLMSHAVQQGGDVVITSGTNTLTLAGVQRSALHANDFDFAAAGATASSASDAEAFIIPATLALPRVMPPGDGLIDGPTRGTPWLDNSLTMPDADGGSILHPEPGLDRHGHDWWM